MKKKEATIQYTVSDTAAYLLQVVRSSLNGEPMPEKPEAVTWAQLFSMSKRQSLALLVYDRVRNLENGPQGELLEKWRNLADKMMTKGVNQTLGCAELMDALDRAKIRTLPMKGYYIRTAYPAPELREMTDIDILVEGNLSDEMQSAMRSIGYEQTAAHDLHATYTKKPYLMVEAHSKLLPDYVGHGDYYQDIWSRVTPEKDRPSICHLSASDTFIHILLHFVKHYRKNDGCGIRFAVDFYTYCRFYETKLDWPYIWDELKKLGVNDLAEDVLGLGQAWFGNGEMTQRQMEMGMRMASGGVFGSREGRDRNQVMQYAEKSGSVRIGKLKFFFSAVFPPLEEMKRTRPVLQKAPILLPLFWIGRGFKILFSAPKQIVQYIKRIQKAG